MDLFCWALIVLNFTGQLNLKLILNVDKYKIQICCKMSHEETHIFNCLPNGLVKKIHTFFVSMKINESTVFWKCGYMYLPVCWSSNMSNWNSKWRCDNSPIIPPQLLYILADVKLSTPKMKVEISERIHWITFQFWEVNGCHGFH